jgi:hypothetical protein
MGAGVTACPHCIGDYMDIKELSELAKTQVEALFSMNLTKNELVALLGLVQARVYSRVYSVPSVDISSHTIANEAVVENKTIPVAPIKPAKPVAYDPVYDPIYIS